jgi:hypothetical protein
MVPSIRRSAVLLAATRREYVPIGSTSASMPPTVAASNTADRLASDMSASEVNNEKTGE